MPEGDTVWRTCQRLHTALAGRELLVAELRWPGLSTAKLAGAGVVEVVPVGKHILIRLENGLTLHSHLKMEGQWRIEAAVVEGSRVKPGMTGPGTAAAGMTNALGTTASGMTNASGTTASGTTRPSATKASATSGAGVRVVLANAEWTAIGLRLGQLDLVRTAEEATLIGHLGPDILTPDFDTARALANLSSSSTTIGAALLDQTNLAGIGTFWASEALFLERLSPWTPAAQLGGAQLEALVARARRMMQAALPHAVQSTTGSRRPGETSYVHARSGRPCRRCGTTIRVAPIGPPTRERVMFYCPGCQGGLAPGDNGRPIAPLGSNRRGRGRRPTG